MAARCVMRLHNVFTLPPTVIEDILNVSIACRCCLYGSCCREWPTERLHTRRLLTAARYFDSPLTPFNSAWPRTKLLGELTPLKSCATSTITGTRQSVARWTSLAAQSPAGFYLLPSAHALHHTDNHICTTSAQ